MSQLSQNTESRITSLERSRPFDNASLRRAEVERDLEIVDAIQAGSSAAFEELLRQYSRRLFSTILRVTENREDAEDALQDTFLRAFLALPQFERRSSVYSWLTRIAINSALMILRKRRSHREISNEAPLESGDGYCRPEIEDAAPNPEQLCEIRQQCNRLINAIQRLTPQLRAPIEIQLTDEHSMKEIARQLNISLPAVKARLHRARARLARRIPVREGMWASAMQ